jgi:hypothetical protein
VTDVQVVYSTMCQPDRAYLPLPSEIVVTSTKYACEPSAAASFQSPQYYEQPRGFSSSFYRTPPLHF